MHLFWARGYEPATLPDLRDVMGPISSGSFYAAFGSKEALFREALDLYSRRHASCLEPLFDPSLAGRAAVEQALQASVDMQTDKNHPPGCLVCSSTANCSPSADGVRAFVAQIRARNHRAIRACVDRGIESGDFGSGANAAALAATFNGTLLGISDQARDGVGQDVLHASVNEVMRLWSPTPGRRPDGAP